MCVQGVKDNRSTTESDEDYEKSLWISSEEKMSSHRLDSKERHFRRGTAVESGHAKKMEKELVNRSWHP